MVINGLGCCYWCNGRDKIYLVYIATLLPIKDQLNAVTDVDIVADHVPQFMTTVQLSSNRLFQQDNTMSRKKVLKGLPEAPELNYIEHIWNVVEG